MDPNFVLTKDTMQNRYLRQILMPEVGELGQGRLKKTSVLVVGLGGLGTPAALYLAAAGVGRLGLIDYDTVDVSNLHRQILYSTQEQGASKVECAKQRLTSFNPEITIETYNERLSIANAEKIMTKYDVILDGADNFATRYLVHDAAFFLKKTLVSASVLGFEGQLTVFSPGEPCYRCLYPEPPPAGSVPSCAEAGVFGVAPGIMGTLQANEVLKHILGIGDVLNSQILMVNILNSQFIKLKMTKNPDCPLCGTHPSIKSLQEENFVCSTDSKIKEINYQDLQSWSKNKHFQLLDVREAKELLEGLLDYTHHIPLKELEERYTSLSQETPIVVYCQTGGRSLKACTLLQAKGYHVYNLQGGLPKKVSP